MSESTNKVNTFLGLGSNEGKRVDYIQMARYFIQSEIGQILQQSNIYESESWGIDNQDLYLNQVIEVGTTHSSIDLLEIIHEIETKLGRKRNFHWSSRTIDIDILTYGNQIIKEENLIIPHQFIAMRNFVLYPLCDIAPEVIHPEMGKSFSELLKNCQDKKEVRIHHGA